MCAVEKLWGHPARDALLACGGYVALGLAPWALMFNL